MPNPQPRFNGLFKSSSIPVLYPTTAWICPACQNASIGRFRRAASSVAPANPVKATTSRRSGLTEEQMSAFIPPTLKPLAQLIGVDSPPKVGENPAKDHRPYSERRREYWQKEAHEKRRKQIYAEMRRPTYQDWDRMRHHKGKTFLAPETPFKANLAKYFPNFQGYTLADSWSYLDTTKVLKGHITIVGYTSQTWADWQVKSFVGRKEHPELAKVLEELKGQGLQEMYINYEEDLAKKILIYLFLWYARRKNDREYGRDVRARSLIVTQGVTREFLEEKLGITNLKVGYLFLVDQNCKIRWVGNGDATDEEKQSLVRVTRRLVGELKESEKMKKAKKPKVVEKEEKDKKPKPLGAMMMK